VADDLPEKTESYYVEVDPSVEYADDKTGRKLEQPVKCKVIKPEQPAKKTTR
jgi:hypothetical protein